MNRSLLAWLTDAFGAILFACGLALFTTQKVQGQIVPVIAAGVIIVSAALRMFAQSMAAASGENRAAQAKAALRAPIVAWLFRQPPARHVMLGEAIADASDRVEDVHYYHARFQPLRRAAVIAPLMIAAAAAVASPVAAGILIATLFPFALGMALAGMAAGKAAREQLDALSRLSGLFVDRVRTLPIILGFGAQDRVVRQLSHSTNEVAERTVRVLRVAFASGAILEFFAALSVALVAVYCGFNLLGLLPFPVPETLTLTQALFVLALAPEFYLPFRRLAAAYHDRQIGEAAMQRLAGLNIGTQVQAPPPALLAPPMLRFCEVVIDHGERQIGPFSFDVPAGRTTALLGPTGIGKSSLLHALLNLADVASGTIMLDGHPLPTAGLGGAVSWAGQATALLPGSIADNIALGDPAASRSDLTNAADLAGLASMLADRAGGLDAHLDAQGGGLSGGERRRIGLARAALRNAPLWLLDEPTADLDAESARAVMNRLLSHARGRTILLVTHSASLAALCDRTEMLA